jgi:catechol 2,3-dioxygenase-like lactoylglutathione lyase family enzyme
MADAVKSKPPVLVQTVLDTEDARRLAEFYRELFGLTYRAGDEPPPAGEPDPRGEDWLVLKDPNGQNQLAFQQIEHLPPATWPEGPQPQMLHLDTVVPTVEDLFVQRQRALDLGARELYDRSEDPDEPLFVLADPSGHPFCIFVGE